MSTVSVIVPVYMVEPYLRRCIDSVLAQSCQDFDLILVDDGSLDRCGAICDEYASRDQRISVIHQYNAGLSSARNAGIDWALSNSNSKWISFLDSDDWIHPEFLERLLNAIQATGLQVAVAKYYRTNGSDPVPVIEETAPAVRKTEDFYCTDKITATIACGKIFRKTDFSRTRFPAGRIHEDEFTTYKILFRYEQIAVVDQPLYLYYQNPQSIMGGKWNPKHIAECDGLREQLQFFIENGFHRAEQTAAKVYLSRIYHHLRNAKQDERFKAEQMRLHRRLRTELLRFGNQAELTIQNAPWLYYEAFPYLTLPYRAIRKFRKTEKSH